MQSSSHIITTNKPTPNFLHAGCPSCHPTNSVRALSGNLIKTELLNKNQYDYLEFFSGKFTTLICRTLFFLSKYRCSKLWWWCTYIGLSLDRLDKAMLSEGIVTDSWTNTGKHCKVWTKLDPRSILEAFGHHKSHLPTSSQNVTTSKPTSSFLQAGCPSCQPKNSVKALKGWQTNTHRQKHKLLRGINQSELIPVSR